ncbi:hypothetical protein CW734_07385 [Planococcus sp. MB-3u-03]|uniref:hypothetical protein n=1 Tax=Planococcus sp. MB-3u-03 TaxID=2058136 RepID=UPI000C33BA9E|nr:hypothetical protein [Planococcus sp. MB-3u-03]AUD13530.1 hypothetical protein CW734_07385 [Planococcus sp. MB-3u-03]
MANSGHMPVDEMDRFMELYFAKTNELQDFAENILKIMKNICPPHPLITASRSFNRRYPGRIGRTGTIARCLAGIRAALSSGGS